MSDASIVNLQKTIWNFSRLLRCSPLNDFQMVTTSLMHAPHPLSPFHRWKMCCLVLAATGANKQGQDNRSASVGVQEGGWCAAQGGCDVCSYSRACLADAYMQAACSNRRIFIGLLGVKTYLCITCLPARNMQTLTTCVTVQRHQQCFVPPNKCLSPQLVQLYGFGCQYGKLLLEASHSASSHTTLYTAPQSGLDCPAPSLMACRAQCVLSELPLGAAAHFMAPSGNHLCLPHALSVPMRESFVA